MLPCNKELLFLFSTEGILSYGEISQFGEFVIFKHSAQVRILIFCKPILYKEQARNIRACIDKFL